MFSEDKLKNLKLAHTRGRIVEENHYYAFGLRIATISSKKLADQTGNEGNTTNSYLYNDKELFDDGDLGWYDYGFRYYDAQIGRFIEIDPLTDDYTLLSGYHYALNDPVSNIDVDGLSSINPLMQMLQCPGVVLHESIKIGLTQAISSLANGLAQNLQQKNTAQQAGKQGGVKDMHLSTQSSLDGVRGGPTAFEMNQRMEILAKMEWQHIVRKSWVHTYSNRWVNTVTGQVRYESQAIESVNWELYVMPLPKFGFLGGVWGKLLAREGEVVAAKTSTSLVNQGTKAILKNGYYEVNGFKFSEYYYNKLWSTGRGAPSLVAREVLEGGAKTAVPDAVKAGFNKYIHGGW